MRQTKAAVASATSTATVRLLSSASLNHKANARSGLKDRLRTHRYVPRNIRSLRPVSGRSDTGGERRHLRVDEGGWRRPAGRWALDQS